MQMRLFLRHKKQPGNFVRAMRDVAHGFLVPVFYTGHSKKSTQSLPSEIIIMMTARKRVPT